MKINALDFLSKGQTFIQEAVDVCAQNGGGEVIIPTGEWKTGPIHLCSNITLTFEEGTILQFSDKFEDYLPVVFTRWEGMECYNYSPLIYANNCENITIKGKGILKGNGQTWWHWKKLQQEAANELCYAESNHVPVEKRIYGTEKAALRPSFIQPIHCKNVMIEDITVIDGPQWSIHPVYCEDVVVRNVTVLTKGPNTDGLNPDSCKNVLIEKCTFDTGDDCIAINAGMNEDGWRVAKPCENIEIKDCIMTGGHGGVVIGSGMSGGVKKISMHDCDISGTAQGIRLKSMRGRGGYVEDIEIYNIYLHDLTEQAIQINMFYGASTVVPKSAKAPIFRNIHIHDVKGVNTVIGIELIGLEEQPLQNITLTNIDIQSQKSMTCIDVDGITLENVKVKH